MAQRAQTSPHDLRNRSLLAWSALWFSLSACSPHLGRLAPGGADDPAEPDAAVAQDSALDVDSEADAELDGDAGAERDGDVHDGTVPDDGGLHDDAGSEDAAPIDLRRGVESGVAEVTQRPRPGFGALLVAARGTSRYVIESRRDAEPGPYQLPWRSRFRLAAYEADELVWTFDAEPDDSIGDVVAHPSGDVTLALQRHAPERLAYQLLRLSREGKVVARTDLGDLASLPASDLAPEWPHPLFRMKSAFADALSAGWLRLTADGDDLWAAILSYVDVAQDHPLRLRMVLGIARFDFEDGTYRERWARLVDGPHAAEPAAWAYDELRWREQAVRPFLAVDATSGELWIGRAWNSSRCEANVARFAEFGPAECVLGAVNVAENERLPLAVTRFSSAGERRGTSVLRPEANALEQVPFALAARGGQLTVAGSLVRAARPDVPRTYPDAGGYVDYDGYLGIYDARGVLLRQHDFNLGRGDVLTALHWSDAGIAAVGASGWDRWQGGMSISRGADPLLVWMSNAADAFAAQVVALSAGGRHYNLHDLSISRAGIEGYGLGDAPMTHSADGGKNGERSHGFLKLRWVEP